MPMGTNLLVQIFEAFTENGTHQRTFRRLYCETGQAATKAYRFVNDATRERMDEIIPKCEDCKHSEIKPITIVLMFDELVRIKRVNLLKEAYRQIGTGVVRYASTICNKKTKDTLSKVGLCK